MIQIFIGVFISYVSAISITITATKMRWEIPGNAHLLAMAWVAPVWYYFLLGCLFRQGCNYIGYLQLIILIYQCICMTFMAFISSDRVREYFKMQPSYQEFRPSDA